MPDIEGDFQIVPPEQRVNKPDKEIERFIRGRIPQAEYRGTDPLTGNEYWHWSRADPPISFIIVRPPKGGIRIVVWDIGGKAEG